MKGYQGCCFFSSNNSNISFICTKVKLGLYILNLAHKVRKFAEYFFVVTMLLYNKSYSGKPVLFFSFFLKCCHIYKQKAFVGQPAELRMWIAHEKLVKSSLPIPKSLFCF